VKVILRSSDLSLIRSAQIALDAHDIPNVVSGDDATGLPSNPSSLAVLDDKDFDRAAGVLRELTHTPRKPWWEASWAPRALLILFIVLVLILCASLIF
jgi:hypothetical protein